MKHFIPAVLFSIAIATPAPAQRIVDPANVAPEFREAAEKRRAEQIRIINCNNSAKIANIPARDQLKFMSDCVDRPDDKPSDISATRK